LTIEFLFIAQSTDNIFFVTVVFEVCPGMDGRGEDHQSRMNGGERGGFSEKGEEKER
jgi:hypothetical protein